MLMNQILGEILLHYKNLYVGKGICLSIIKARRKALFSMAEIAECQSSSQAFTKKFLISLILNILFLKC